MLKKCTNYKEKKGAGDSCALLWLRQVLENRTRDSKMEMEVLENLQELKELNQRQAQVDFESMIGQYRELEQQQRQREVEEDERETK